MNNVVAFPRSRASSCSDRQAMTEAQRLLAVTMASILDNDGEANACHLQSVLEARSLLRQVCTSSDDAACHSAINALSLVELARFAMEAGDARFNCCSESQHGCAIADGLNAALDRIEWYFEDIPQLAG